MAREALEGARRLGDGVLEAWALVLAGWADVYAHPDEARALLVAGRASAQDSGDLQLTEFASYGLGTVEATTGRFDSARAALAAGIAIARTGRQLDLQYGLGMLGYVEVLQGGLAAATALLREATSSLGGDLDRVHRDMASTFLAVALLYQGDYAGARARLDEAIATARAVGSPPTFAVLHLGLLERALGHHQAAIERVAPVLAAVEQFGPWFDVEALVCLGEVTAATGDTSTAATHWRGAMVRAERSGNLLARTVAGVGLARLAALESDTDRARTLLRGALRAAGAAGFRLGAVDALEALAVQTGDPGLLAAVDGERARIGYVRFPLDEPAYERAMAALGNDAEAPTARPGPAPFDDAIARAVRGESRPARPPLGWDSLTPAEMRVAALVAYGLSNPEIGERLLVSRRTVQAHLSHIYAKLGVAGRVELAAAWKPRTRDE